MVIQLNLLCFFKTRPQSVKTLLTRRYKEDILPSESSSKSHFIAFFKQLQTDGGASVIPSSLHQTAAGELETLAVY